MVGLVIALGWHMFFRGKVDVAGPPGDAAPGDQKAEGAESYGWLVQAMAEFSTSSGAPTSLGGSEQQTVETVIAANWKSA